MRHSLRQNSGRELTDILIPVEQVLFHLLLSVRSNMYYQARIECSLIEFCCFRQLQLSQQPYQIERWLEFSCSRLATRISMMALQMLQGRGSGAQRLQAND